MPQMDSTGPENKGSQSGRKLGKCVSNQEKDISMLGKGMGKRRKMDGGSGLGKRLKYNSIK